MSTATNMKRRRRRETQPTTRTTGSYFEGGRTNRVEADFEAVECGCAGRTISGQSSGKEAYSSAAIAIATLTALVALLVLVCLCLLHLKKRRSPAQVSGTIKYDTLHAENKYVCFMFGGASNARGMPYEGSGFCVPACACVFSPFFLRWYSIYLSVPRLFFLTFFKVFLYLFCCPEARTRLKWRCDQRISGLLVCCEKKTDHLQWVPVNVSKKSC